MTLVAERPAPVEARPFRFPAFTRTSLPNGLTLIVCDLPGRPLGTASLLLEAGAFVEDPTHAGVALLMARALQEGTTRRDATAFADAVEALGADLSTSTSSELLHAAVRAPVSRLADALTLLAEAVVTPAFPDANVDRLRAQRLSQIAQEREVPGQRALETFLAKTYTPESPYARPLGGTAESVAGIGRDAIAAHHAANIVPSGSTLIVAGDLGGIDVDAAVAAAFGDWSGAPTRAAEAVVASASDARAITVVHRPGSVQSNLVIGHVGLPRSTPDHTALEIVEQVYGGSFGCRLNTRLREEKGYTYGARGMFDFRRHAGPFYSFASVETTVTAPAVADTVEIIATVADHGVTQDEIDYARGELAGGFALRFETAEAVANGIGEIVTYGLDDDTFDTYEARLAAVTVDDAARVAKAHIHADRLQIVVVGDADQVAGPLEATGLGPVTVV